MIWHINSDTLTTISGPYAIDSAYIRALTRCGTPEVLNLSQYGLVPEVRDPLGPNQKHGDPVITATDVTFPAVDKTADELAAELAQYRDGLSCDPAQGRLLLHQQGVLDDMEAWIVGQPRAVKIEYESRTEWRRTWSTIIAGIAYLGWTDEQADQFFEVAKTL